MSASYPNRKIISEYLPVLYIFGLFVYPLSVIQKKYVSALL